MFFEKTLNSETIIFPGPRMRRLWRSPMSPYPGACNTFHFSTINMKHHPILLTPLLAALPLYQADAGIGSAITADVTVNTRTSAPVNIPDAALLTALRTALAKPTGAITEADLLTLTSLRIAGLGIADLSGLEKATNLRILDIRRNAFADPAALWAVLDQITPMYCLYVDVRRPGNDPAGLLTQTLTDTSGNSFFILLDTPNLPTLDFNSLDISTTNSANLQVLQVISNAGVQVDTGGVNLPPYASASAGVSDAATRAVTLSPGAGDVDGSIASYAWSWPGGSSASAAPTITVPYGTTSFSLTVTDDDGATASSSASVTLSPLATVDSDGDGLNDLIEYTLRGQGFDWNAAQPSLTAAVASAGLISRENLAAEGFYTLAAMRALQAPAPVIARDAGTGKVRLSLGILQSTNLSTFTPLPATTPQVSVTPQGKIQFEFDAPAGAGFFRIEAK